MQKHQRKCNTVATNSQMMRCACAASRSGRTLRHNTLVFYVHRMLRRYAVVTESGWSAIDTASNGMDFFSGRYESPKIQTHRLPYQHTLASHCHSNPQHPKPIREGRHGLQSRFRFLHKFCISLSLFTNSRIVASNINQMRSISGK